MNRDNRIPYCHDKFLRDVSIAIGLRFITHDSLTGFSVGVDTCAHDGEDFERLSIWARPYYGVWMNLTLWDDGTVWFSASSWSCDGVREYEVGFYPDNECFTAARIAEAFHDSEPAAMRLCYEECPLPILRRIWHHEGTVETTGKLRSAKNSVSQ